MSLDTAVAYFRQRQSSLFRSTCDIKVKTGETFDDGTGAYTPTFTTRASGVSCLIRPRSAEELQAGETEVTLERFIGKFPVDQTIEVNDVITVTSSTYDVGLVGKEFTVMNVLFDDFQISRKAVLEHNAG